jgi:16S rRNA processing protein RimM
MTRPEWIEVGRVARPHGVHGEVRVVPDSDNPERFAPGSVVYARPARVGMAGPRLPEQSRLTVESIRGDDGFPIVAFREVDDRDGAEAIRGYVLEVSSSELPVLSEDEFYPFDLERLEVRDPQGAAVGRVKEAMESPAHAILVVALESGQEVLVPFVMAAVPMVALSEGYLVVDPEFLNGAEMAGESSTTDDDGGRGEAGADRSDRP